MLMLLFNIKKTRCHFDPRLLYFWYSLYLLALDLSLAIQSQNYTRLSLQILADIQSCQCLCLSTSAIKRLLPSRLFLNNYRLFWTVYSLLSQKIISCRYQSKPLVIIFCKIIFDQRAITNQSPLRFILAFDNSPEFQNNNREILISRCE